MRVQQGRVGDYCGCGQFLNPILIPNRSPSSHGELISGKLTLELTTLYGHVPRNNESIQLGERPKNPNAIVVDDDDGFAVVLDL